MAICAVITMGLAMPVSGQQSLKETPFDAPQSNQIQATAGVFGTDVDDYLDVNSWSGVEFGKWFGYITGGYFDDENNQGPFAIDLGYATKLGGGKIYLGTRYVGNILQITGDPGPAVSTNTIEVDYPNPTTSPNPTQTEKTVTYGDGWYNSTNQIGVLVGFGKIGISAGFFESISTNKFDAPTELAGTPYSFTTTVNNTTGAITYSNQVTKYVETAGHLTPSLGFGINLTAGSLGIKPYAGLSLDIFKDVRIVNTKDGYTVNQGTTSFGSQGVSYEGENKGNMIPSITVGAKLELPKKDTTEMTVGLEYGIGFGIFSNDYDAGLASGSASGDVKWTGSTTVNRYIDRTETTQTAELDFKDHTYMSHAITPSFLITKEINGLKLGFQAEVPFNMTFITEDSYSQNTNVERIQYDLPVYQQRNTTNTTVEKRYNGFADVSIYNIAPVLGVGASYQLVPNRFRVNVGVSAVPINFTRTIIKTSPNGEAKDYETTVDGYGNTTLSTIDDANTYPDTKTDEVEVQDTLDAFTGNVTGGFVFSFNDNFALDFLVGVSLNSYGSNYQDGTPITYFGPSASVNKGTNGFKFDLTNVKLLFTFKF